MHWHLKAGWVYDAFVGSDGGWKLPQTNGTDVIVCQSRGANAKLFGRKWHAFVVRQSDGATLKKSEHDTRDEAMRRPMLAVA